ncbi:hypothetical protein [Kordia sp.]|uniref:hypothetical protein n=1 Tax=Kordia sp. TaxID=1965332 RepID=UPI0025B950EF|nr:hypothetical protein [Kordia sp.]MCH2193269.1 hypothetical protein [Kordia sp.]
MAKRKSYAEEVEKLCKVIDIAIEAYKKHPPQGWDSKNIDWVTSCLEKDKVSRLTAEKSSETWHL